VTYRIVSSDRADSLTLAQLVPHPIRTSRAAAGLLLDLARHCYGTLRVEDATGHPVDVSDDLERVRSHRPSMVRRGES
jgi:hypothetical protein